MPSFSFHGRSRGSVTPRLYSYTGQASGCRDTVLGLQPFHPLKPGDVLEAWWAEFDKAYEGGTLFHLTMHTKYIGHRSRIAMLEELINYMQSHEGLWFATHADIARYVAGAGD